MAKRDGRVVKVLPLTMHPIAVPRVEVVAATAMFASDERMAFYVGDETGQLLRSVEMSPPAQPGAFFL